VPVLNSAERCSLGVQFAGAGSSACQPCNRRDAMSDAELPIRIRDMALDRSQADHHSIGYLLVPQALSDEAQNLEFTCRERLGEASDYRPGRG
jgi:hypothetical protein